MILNYAKKVPLVLSIAATSVAFGAMSTNERVAQLESKMNCVYMEVVNSDCDPQVITCGAHTAPARPNIKGDCRCGGGWFIAVDAIYWHPKAGGTEYAYSDNSPVLLLNGLNGTGFPVKGRSKDIDFSWDWGFKVALGYNFEHDGWDAMLQYTRLDTSGEDGTRAGMNSTIIPLRGSASITQGDGTGPTPQGVFVFCESAKSEFDFDYDRVDLEMGRNFYVSPKLALRPFIGLVGAWIDLHQKTRYTGGDPDATSNPDSLGLSVNTVHINDESDFKGLGPKFGIDSKWHLGHKFSILGNISGAFLYGHYDVSHKERYSLLPQNRISINADMNRFAPNATYELGLAYDTYLNDMKQHLGISVSYEGHYWFRTNQMLKIDDFAVLKYERYSEDVSLHGITIDVRLDF